MAKKAGPRSTPANGGEQRFVDLVRRYDLNNPEPAGLKSPASPDEALERLRSGNARFAEFMMNCRTSLPQRPVVIPCDRTEVGLGEHDAYGRPRQRPFALILGCSDAREPAEILLGQGFDDLFTVRVAGNVLGDECVGSVIYALDKFTAQDKSTPPGSLKLILVIGHRNCGAVHAAVESYEADPSSLLERLGSTPPPLAKIVVRIDPVVRVAAWALERSYGVGSSLDRKHTEVLTEIAVYLNAAWAAFQLEQLVRARYPVSASSPVAVRFGIFDLSNDYVQGGPPPYLQSSSAPKKSFGMPPDSADWFPRFADKIARAFTAAFPNGDIDLQNVGYTQSAWKKSSMTPKPG